MTTRKQYSRTFKAPPAVEAIRAERTLNQLATQCHVHPVQIGRWRKTAMEQLPELFVHGRKRRPRDGDVEKEALYEEIGWLHVEPDRAEISLRCQCELLAPITSGRTRDLATGRRRDNG